MNTSYLYLKGRDEMLQYPVNVYPENIAVNADIVNGRYVGFDFRGDRLSNVIYRIYNYNTGEIVTEFIKSTDLYNMDNTKTTISDGLTNGSDYVLQMLLSQNNISGNEPLYDIPILRGVVFSSEYETVDNTKIPVENNISSIYEWNHIREPVIADGKIIAGMVIKIGDETRFITSYNSNENEELGIGLITVNEQFYNGIRGKPYQIFSNYLITPQYYFKCRSAPNVELVHNCYSNRIIVNGKYMQAENSMIKYYTLKLYWSDIAFDVSYSSVRKTELVAETDKIYSQKIHYEFWNPYRHDESHSNGMADYYKIVCEVCTQDNVIHTNNLMFGLVPEDYSEFISNRLFKFTLSYDKNTSRVYHRLTGYHATGSGINGTFELFREDLKSGEVVQLNPNHFVNEGFYGSVLVGYDSTIPTQGSYRYILKRFDNDGKIIIPVLSENYNGIGNFPCSDITINDLAYYIMDLTPIADTDEIYHPNAVGNKKPMFIIGDTWKFTGEIQNTTVTQNLDRINHVGYGKYTSLTSTDVNYMSGTLSAMLGYVDCTTQKYTDDIALVKAWRKFISQPKPFILKSQKGDVWIVNISANPTTEYEENNREIPVTFSFSWSECCNINDVVIFESERVV